MGAFCGTDLDTIIVESGNTKYDSREDCNAIIRTSANEIILGCKNTKIPNTITAIGWYAFSGLMISVTIPNSVTSISNNSFYYCSGIETINIESGNTEYDSRDNCNAIIESKTNCLLLGCKNTTIPCSVTAIGDNAFKGCDFTSIIFPTSVTSIGNSALYFCQNLTSIVIPNSVTSIGGDAFAGCKSLNDFYCFAENLPITSAYIFEFSPINNGTLHVPATSIDYYKATYPWNGFGNIVPIADNDPKPTNVIKYTYCSMKGDVFYTLDGHRTTQPRKGVNIVKKNNGTICKFIVK